MLRFITLIVIALSLFIFTNCNSPAGKKNAGEVSASQKPGPEQLVGEWVRTDGGYILKILSTSGNGKLEAGYYNPNPINVGRAEWQLKDNNLMITVELRDENYPGSTYTLNYLPAEDALVGNYYQAVERVNFNVGFIRKK